MALDMSKILITDQGCWEWQGSLTRDGYGPHRRWYSRLRGPIPVGLTLDHLCRNKSCVNPDHMEPVTTQENTRRAVEAGNGGGRPRQPDISKRQGCKAHGEDDGLWTIRRDGYTYYRCRHCVRAAGRRYRERRQTAK